MAYAYAYRSGEIGFGLIVPDNALEIARGEKRRITNIIKGIARQAYDGKTWLVPGVPEATDQNAAIEALIRFAGEIERRESR